MKLTLPTAAFTALTGLLLLTDSARAVTVTAGDLILGVRASGGQGAGLDLMVNAGPASNYYTPATSTFIVPGLSPLDLSTTYGSGWASRSDLSWGVAGTTGALAVGIAPARTLWASRAEATAGTASDPWTRNLALSLQNSSNAIFTMYTGAPGSLGSGSATPNSSMAALVDDTLGGSWSVQEDLTPGVSFRYFNPSVLRTVSSTPGMPAVYDGVNGYGVLDLWEVRPGTAGTPGTLLGAFGLNSSGLLVFSTNPGVFAAVPEPSTVLTGLGAVMALLLRRRR